MKKLMKILMASGLLFLSATMAAPVTAYAQTGDMGFYGGISQGRKPIKTTEEKYKEEKKKSAKKTTTDEFQYKELILLEGEPVEVSGTIKIKSQGNTMGSQDETDLVGTYKITHTIQAEDPTGEYAINRNLLYNVYWRKEDTQGSIQSSSQYIVTYEPDKKGWNESITTPSGAYDLDIEKSNINVSFILDEVAGVTYSKGTMTSILIYTGGEAEAGGEGEEAASAREIKVQSAGSIYGYDCAWSNVETQRINTYVYAPDWQMQFQLRPSVSMAKRMQYSENEPTAISFTGNYTEILENTSMMSYNVYNVPTRFYGMDETGTMSIDSFNSIEQLLAPNVTFLKGHWAEEDIKKLFSMQILTGPEKFVQPNQAMTRGQYVQALSKAVKLQLPSPDAKKKTKKDDKTANIIFPDVLEDREEHDYIIAAYEAGLAIGRDTGNFYIDSPIQRQEAITILIRTLGLTHLGLDPSPVTPYVDDAMIGDWAKADINAARLLGIVGADADGKLNPTEYLTKAEGAAMINRLIDYMRGDMITDYTEHIINYAD